MSTPHVLARARRTAVRLVSTALVRGAWVRDRVGHPGAERVRFACNVCGHRTSWTRAAMGREQPSCGWCGSTVRFRAVLHAVEQHAAPGARVLGFSDPEVYARRIAARHDYLNTYLHEEPRRDVLRPDTFGGETYDVVVCSEVLEHVVGDPRTAVATLFAILRPGGILVLSVPVGDGPTREHYPGAVDYEVEQVGREHHVHVTTATGERYRAAAPVFHGGPGSVLEMRLWGRDHLRRTLEDAGFADVEEITADAPEHGILHAAGPASMSTPGGTVRGLHAGVWIATRPPRRTPGTPTAG